MINKMIKKIVFVSITASILMASIFFNLYTQGIFGLSETNTTNKVPSDEVLAIKDTSVVAKQEDKSTLLTTSTFSDNFKQQAVVTPKSSNVSASSLGKLTFGGFAEEYAKKSILTLNSASNDLEPEKGNTNGNLVNGGIVAQKGEWIYFQNKSDDNKLYKIKTNDSGKTKLNDDNSNFINVVGEWIYYQNLSDSGKLYKIKSDGTGRIKLNDDKSYEVTVVGEWIYYVNNSDSFNIYKMKTDGTGKTKLNDATNGCINVVGNLIYYRSIHDHALCKIKTDGTGRVKINNSEMYRDYCDINVVGDWIYYQNYKGLGGEIYKIKTDGTGRIKLDSGYSAYLNVVGDWIYYENIYYENDNNMDDRKLYKIKTDGTGKTKLTSNKEYGINEEKINLIGDWVFYYKNNIKNDDCKLYKIKTDGTGNQVAFSVSATSLSGINAIEKISVIDTYLYHLMNYVADPVDSSTGSHVINLSFLKQHGAYLFSFDLQYNSLLLNQGPLGKGWGHNYEAKLEFENSKEIIIHWTASRKNSFISTDGINYKGNIQTIQNDTIVKNSDNTYTLTEKDGTKYIFDSTGKLTTQYNRFGQALNMSYDSSDKLIKITEPITDEALNISYNNKNLIDNVADNLNRKVTFTYDENNYLTVFTDENGHKITYNYDTNGRVLSGIDNDGKQIFSNTYDNQGRVISQDDGADGNKLTTFSYDENSVAHRLLTTVTNRNGNSVIYTYDLNYNLLSKKDELGNVETYEYDSSGNMISSTDKNGSVTKHTYDEKGNVISTINPLGNVVKMSYDKNNNLLSLEDWTGRETVYTYDSNNNLLTTKDSSNKIESSTYDKNSLLLSHTSKEGNSTTYSYKNGLVDIESDTLGNKLKYQYDASGRKIKIIDQLGKEAVISYDNKDNILIMTDPLGNKISTTYDTRGNKLTSTDAKGNVTKYSYDGNSNIISTLDPNGNKISYQYDGEGNLIKVTDPKGNTTKYTYDAAGRKIAITDALGNIVKTAYDSVGNITSKTDALGNVVQTIKYNTLNQQVSEKDALGNINVNKYDKSNRLASIIDAAGDFTKFTYDNLDRMISAADPYNNVSSQVFDNDGKRTSYTDTSGSKTKYSYDSVGRVISETSDAGGTITYEYNAKGLVTKMTNGRGQVTTYSYDDNGRLISSKDNVGSISYSYDANGNVLSQKDDKGVISKVYDKLNRITKYTDSNGNVIGYKYDSIGNLIELTYPNGKVVKYNYDKLNRLKSVTDGSGRITTYEYDADSRLTKVSRPDGSICSYTYDKGSNLTVITDIDKNKTIINQYKFTYDKVGNVITEKQFVSGEAANEQDLSMTYTSGNKIDTFNGKKISFDKDGNMTYGPLNSVMSNYKYDSRNRLIEAGKCKYVYDSENNRIAVTDNGKNTSYVINPNTSLSQVLIKKDADGKQTYYVYGIGLISEEDSAGNYKLYHFDRRGSTTALTDKTGTVTDRYQYDAYGKLVSHKGNSNTPFLYVGKDGVMADSNGLYYMRARYYNTDIKRFINKDILSGTIKDSQTLNRFMYVNGRVVDNSDPLGLSMVDYFEKTKLEVVNLGKSVYLETKAVYYDDFEDKTNNDIGYALNQENDLYGALSLTGAMARGQLRGVTAITNPFNAMKVVSRVTQDILYDEVDTERLNEYKDSTDKMFDTLSIPFGIFKGTCNFIKARETTSKIASGTFDALDTTSSSFDYYNDYLKEKIVTNKLK